MTDAASPGTLGAHVYEALFEETDEGICVVRVLFDDAGAAIAYEYVEVNASFERFSGLKDVRGKRMDQV